MLKILHISDTHFRIRYQEPKNDYEEILYRMNDPIDNLKKCLRNIFLPEIDMVAITGDLCDAGSFEDYARFRKITQELFGDKPVFVTLGNHDDKANFKKAWREEVDENPYHYVKNFLGYTIIGFDNSVFHNPNGYVDDERLQWLQKQLSQAKNPVILLMHHHLHDHPGVKPLPNKEKLEKIIADSKVVMILCGHSHAAYAGTFAKKDYFVAGSMSFKGENHFDNSVDFKEKFGYNLYEVDGEEVACAKIEVISNRKLISTWHF